MAAYREATFISSTGQRTKVGFTTESNANYHDAADRLNELMKNDPGGRIEADSSETSSFLRNYGLKTPWGSVW